MCINKDELIKWFWDKFNSCYLVKHEDYPESIFMYYDPQYIRKLKLANISREKINKTDKTDITGFCLFQQDWKNKIFYYDYNEIWGYLYSNYSIKYDEIQQFISDKLSEHSKMSVLTPCRFPLYVGLFQNECANTILYPRSESLLVEGTFQNECV